MPTLSESLAESAKQASASLLASLKAQGATDTAALADFAGRYGPIAAEWGLRLATATAAGDFATVEKYQNDLNDIAALATVTASTLAILAQSAVEAETQAFVKSVLQIAAKAALAALV